MGGPESNLGGPSPPSSCGTAGPVIPPVNMGALLFFSSEEEELFVLDCMAYLMVFMAGCTLIALLFENVPYGRYSTSKYGFQVNARFAWFVQELPALLLPSCLLLRAASSKTSVLPNQLLAAMYFWHYVQRWLWPNPNPRWQQWFLQELGLLMLFSVLQGLRLSLLHPRRQTDPCGLVRPGLRVLRL